MLIGDSDKRSHLTLTTDFYSTRILVCGFGSWPFSCPVFNHKAAPERTSLLKAEKTIWFTAVIMFKYRQGQRNKMTRRTHFSQRKVEAHTLNSCFALVHPSKAKTLVLCGLPLWNLCFLDSSELSHSLFLTVVGVFLWGNDDGFVSGPACAII